MGLFKLLFSASGRSRRSTYFSVVIALLSVCIVAFAVMVPMCAFLFIPGVLDIYGIAKPGADISRIILIACSIICLLCIYSILCMTAKRLHDTGRKGINALFLFLPVIGIILLAPVLFKANDGTTNKHGEAPSRKSFMGVAGGIVVAGSIIALMAAMGLFMAVYANTNGKVKEYTGIDVPEYIALYKEGAIGLTTKNDRDWKEWVDEKQENYLAGKIPERSELSLAIFGRDYGLDADRDALTDEVMDIIMVYVTEGTGNTITKEVLGYDNLSIRRRAAYLIASCLYDGTLISEDDIEQSATEQAIGTAVDYVSAINSR